MAGRPECAPGTAGAFRSVDPSQGRRGEATDCELTDPGESQMMLSDSPHSQFQLFTVNMISVYHKVHLHGRVVTRQPFCDNCVCTAAGSARGTKKGGKAHLFL